MDILQFTEELAASDPDGGPRRWAHNTRSTLIEAVLFLAHYADDIPPDLHDEYERFLRQALESLPEGARLNVSRSLQRRLLDVAPPDMEPRLKSLVGYETTGP